MNFCMTTQIFLSITFMVQKIVTLESVTKIDAMVLDAIIKAKCIGTTEEILIELMQFQDFLYRNFRNYERY